MSTLRDPVGPKDRKVYFRRRLLLLAALLAMVIFVVLVVLKPGSSGGASGAREVEVPSDIAGAGSDSEDDEAGDDGEVPACSTGQLAVTPVTDGNSYADGELPQLSLRVENTGADDCAADLGSAEMEFTISSGDDEVWRSMDCQEESEQLAVVVGAGETLSSEAIAWDRTRSDPDTCGITRDLVAAGGASYHLHVSVGAVQGTGTAQFLLN